MDERMAAELLRPTGWRRLAELRKEAAGALTRLPVVGVPLIRLGLVLRRHPIATSDLLVGRDTEVVIEGYPRCANWFAVIAFEMAQGRPVRIAHHLHMAANVLAGVRRGLPCLVLLRDPDQAVGSLVVAYPQVTIRLAYKRYVRFYAPLRRSLDRLVVATFEQVTGDFGAVIRRLNERFGTHYAEFQNTPENVAGVFRRIDQVNLRECRREQVLEAKVSRPSAERRQAVQALAELLEHPSLRELRQAARSIHEEFLARAETDG